jgi:hypothetical protein
MTEAVVLGTKVEKFRERVNLIFNHENGQGLLALMSAEAEREERLTHRRRTIEARVSRVLCGEEAWLARVLVLFNAGLLGKEGSPFSSQSVKNRIVKVLELCGEIFPRIYKRPPPAARQRLAKMREMEAVLHE